MKFTYDKNQVNMDRAIRMSLDDLRVLVQASTIRDDSQRLHEIQKSLASICRKNLLRPGAIDVSDSE